MRARLLAVSLRLLAANLIAAASIASAQIPDRGTTVFTHTNVVPMDAERVLRDQTVVVADGRIVALGASSATSVPPNAMIVDAQGKYLLPGLAEMHGHVPRQVADAEDVLFLYLAGGATTVRGMQGHPAQIELRERVRAGDILGPRLVLAAPAMRGETVPDVATAEQLVRTAKQQGFDLLKVHEGLSADVYAAIVTTATAVGLPWGGHVSAHVGVHGALAARQSTIDHLDDYVEAMQPADSPALGASGAERRRLLALNADESTLLPLARATRDAGVAVVPTQILWETLLGARDPDELAARPENRYMPTATRSRWYARTIEAVNAASRASASREALLRQRLLKTMHDEGVLVLLGTDAPQIFSVPGFSLHREMPLMVEAGLSPYEVLRTGTANVARFFGTESTSGTIAVGKNADLLLLDANPLEDIGAVAQRAGVMIDGRWLSAAYIARRLEAIAAKHRD